MDRLSVFYNQPGNFFSIAEVNEDLGVATDSQYMYRIQPELHWTASFMSQ